MSKRLQCPRCGKAMRELRTPEGVHVDFCRPCGGMWLDGDEGAYAGWRDGLPEPRATRAASAPCPRCSASMHELLYDGPQGDLAIDCCESCGGVWLDRRELQDLRKLAYRTPSSPPTGSATGAGSAAGAAAGFAGTAGLSSSARTGSSDSASSLFSSLSAAVPESRVDKPLWSGLVMCVVGVGILVWSVWAYQNASASAHWPRTDGEVLYSSVGSSQDGDYWPEVTYTYTVDGQEYMSKRITYAPMRAWKSYWRASQESRRYSYGAPVTVFYDPTEPSRAVLNPGLAFSNYMMLVVAVVVLGAGVWLLRKGLTEDPRLHP